MILGDSLFPVVRNVPTEYGGGIIILERKPKIQLLLEYAKKTEVKARREICRMRRESDKLSVVRGKFFEFIIVHVN
jgi:hypothetical protein